jgi:FixJ family two-component response regulator
LTEGHLPANANSNGEAPIVVVVDDDPSLRSTIDSLLRSVGLRVLAFGSAAAFLEAHLPPAVGCLVLDIRLPGQSGLDLQAELVKEDIRIPIIFISGHGDVQMTVRAMKAGAIDFLTKPFRDQELLDAVTVALNLDRKRREGEEKVSTLRARFESLTNREQQVMTLVTSGLMNKQIAHEMGITEITVKIHRGNMMRKMAAKSVADLVRMAEALGSPRSKTMRP